MSNAPENRDTTASDTSDAWCPSGCGFSSDQMFAYVDCNDGTFPEHEDAQTCQHLPDDMRRYVLHDSLELIDEHVAHCPQCQSVLERERALRRRTAQCLESAAPNHLREKVTRMLRATRACDGERTHTNVSYQVRGREKDGTRYQVRYSHSHTESL